MYILDYMKCSLFQIDVGSIAFTHHHLFSIEHHIATKLVEKYTSYQIVVTAQTTKGLDHRLAVLYKKAHNRLDRLRQSNERQQ